MPISSYKEMLTSELELDTFAEVQDTLDFLWGKFAEHEEKLQYLLTKRAMLRWLVSKLRHAVDVEIGYDIVKANALINNHLRLIKDVTEEINEEFPDIDTRGMLVSVSAVPGMTEEYV